MDDRRELQIIQELMEQLQDEMKPSQDDFESRLGRKKPAVEIVKVESKDPLDMKSDLDPMQDHMDDQDPHQDMGMDDSVQDEMSPEEMLKQRLLKLRQR